MTVGTITKIAIFTILGCIGFLVLWGITFFLSLPFTSMNIPLSLILSFTISAITIFALGAVLTPSRKRVPLVLSKKQWVGIYVAWFAIFVCSIPLIIIDVLIFLSFLPTLTFVTLVVIYGTLKWRKELQQK